MIGIFVCDCGGGSVLNMRNGLGEHCGALRDICTWRNNTWACLLGLCIGRLFGGHLDGGSLGNLRTMAANDDGSQLVDLRAQLGDDRGERPRERAEARGMCMMGQIRLLQCEHPLKVPR